MERWGERLTLRREAGRARIVFDYNPPNRPREKKVIPREAGDAGLPLSGCKCVPKDAIIWAEAFLEKKAFAKSRLFSTELANSGVLPTGTTLGLVFDQYRQSTEFANLRPKYQRDMTRVMEAAEAVLGRKLELDAWDQEACDRLVEERKRGIKLNQRGSKRLLRGAGKTTCRTMIVMLRSVFRWALGRKHPARPGMWLIQHDPFARVKVPKKGVARVSILTHGSYEIMRDHADAVDPTGRLRLILADARWTGHRLGAICQTLRSDVLLMVEDIEDALHCAICKYVPVDEIPRVAELYGRHGAIYRRFEVQKQGVFEDEEAVQYDRVVPLGPEHRAEIDRYLQYHWTPIGVPNDGPLFPSVSDYRRCLYIDLPQKWWVACEKLARQRGHKLRKLERTRYHGFRRLRRTELKQARIHEKDIAFIGGWTINSFPDAKGSTAMNGLYLGFSPEDLLEAVCTGQEDEGVSTSWKMLARGAANRA